MKSLQGHLLIASKELVDPNFFRSVVLIIQHNDEGAMGVILNRPSDTAVADAWEQVFHTDCEYEGLLHQGGPCEGPLMVVHGEADAAQFEVAPGIQFSTDKDSIKWLIRHKAAPMKFFVGYAGWAGGQLESELATDSWLVTPATTDVVFDNDQRQWDDLMKRISRNAIFESLKIRHVPEDPSVN